MTHHLGSWVSALADGQLGPAESERALAHVAGCPACADQLAAARQASRTLAVVRDAEPAPDLTARLLALAGQPSDGSEPGPFGARPDRRAPVLPLGSSAYSASARALTGDLTTRHLPWLQIAAGSAAGLVVVGVSLFQLGARPSVVPSAHPAQALSILGGASERGSAGVGTWAPGLAARITAVSATSIDDATTNADLAVLTWMDDVGWTCPLALPEGYEVTGARFVGDADDVLELDLDGPDGRIVFTEQRGQLDVAALGDAARLAVAGRTVYVLTLAPWHAVWQSGDTVVSIVADAPTPSTARLVADFPAAGYDDGLPARLTRGWHTVTGAFSRP